MKAVLSAVGILMFGAFPALGGETLHKDMTCKFLEGSPRVVIFNEATACTTGKPVHKYVCVGGIVCSRPGKVSRHGAVMCPMPDEGCNQDGALSCVAQSKNDVFSVASMSDVNLSSARTYKRALSETGTVQAGSVPFHSSGLVRDGSR